MCTTVTAAHCPALRVPWIWAKGGGAEAAARPQPCHHKRFLYQQDIYKGKQISQLWGNIPSPVRLPHKAQRHEFCTAHPN